MLVAGVYVWRRSCLCAPSGIIRACVHSCHTLIYDIINWAHTLSQTCCSATIICGVGFYRPLELLLFESDQCMKDVYGRVFRKIWLSTNQSEVAEFCFVEAGGLSGCCVCYDSPRFVISWQMELFTSGTAYRGHGTIKTDGLHFSTRSLSSP